MFTTDIHLQFRSAGDGEQSVSAPAQIGVGMDWVGCYHIAMQKLAHPRCVAEERASSVELQVCVDDPSSPGRNKCEDKTLTPLFSTRPVLHSHRIVLVTPGFVLNTLITGIIIHSDGNFLIPSMNGIFPQGIVVQDVIVS